MGFAQVSILLLSVVALCFAANQHGKPRKGSVNFWITLTMVCFNVVILAFGGFFTGAFNFTL